MASDIATNFSAVLPQWTVPLLGVKEKSATYSDLHVQGSEARRASELRPPSMESAGVTISSGVEDAEVTHRSSASGYKVPTVSSPAAPAKARALKAPADLKPSQRLRLDELARLLRGGRPTYSFLSLQSTTTINQNQLQSSSAAAAAAAANNTLSRPPRRAGHATMAHRCSNL